MLLNGSNYICKAAWWKFVRSVLEEGGLVGATKEARAMAVKYTLAYDGHCAFCEDTARAVSDQTGGDLRVVPLQSAYVREAHKALNTPVPNAPVLIKELAGGGKKTYMGAKLSAELFNAFGIGKSYRMLRAIGEAKNGGGSRLLSRSGFLKRSLDLGSCRWRHSPGVPQWPKARSGFRMLTSSQRRNCRKLRREMQSTNA